MRSARTSPASRKEHSQALLQKKFWSSPSSSALWTKTPKLNMTFYTGTARVMAEVAQGVQMEDYADDFIHDSLNTGLVLHDKPFASSGPEGWKGCVLTPAMLSLALRAQENHCGRQALACADK
eukprot:5948895-Pyramimonas_sp.AAC.1